MLPNRYTLLDEGTGEVAETAPEESPSKASNPLKPPEEDGAGLAELGTPPRGPKMSVVSVFETAAGAEFQSTLNIQRC